MQQEDSKSSPGARRDALFRAVEGLQHLTELFDRRRQQLADEAGVSDQQWRVLEEIGRDTFMPSLFARSRECAPAAVSRTLRQLLDRRLVVVSISKQDARQRDYALTARGRRILEDLHESRERALEVVWRGFSRADLERFAGFSERLAERLEAYARTEKAAE